MQDTKNTDLCLCDLSYCQPGVDALYYFIMVNEFGGICAGILSTVSFLLPLVDDVPI